MPVGVRDAGRPMYHTGRPWQDRDFDFDFDFDDDNDDDYDDYDDDDDNNDDDDDDDDDECSFGTFNSLYNTVNRCHTVSNSCCCMGIP